MNYAKCEVRFMIRFLIARELNFAEIRRYLVEFNGESVVSKEKVRQWSQLSAQPGNMWRWPDGKPVALALDLPDSIP